MNPVRHFLYDFGGLVRHTMIPHSFDFLLYGKCA